MLSLIRLRLVYYYHYGYAIQFNNI